VRSSGFGKVETEVALVTGMLKLGGIPEREHDSSLEKVEQVPQGGRSEEQMDGERETFVSLQAHGQPASSLVYGHHLSG
jgi:hypothetical protein